MTKILKIIFTWLLLVVSAQSAEDSLREGDQQAAPSPLCVTRRAPLQYVFEMGFELETNGIKVQHPDEDTILILMQSDDGKWQLTTDTHDEKIEKVGWVNLECRTCGGLSQEEIHRYKELTQQILRQIKQACDSSPNGQWCLPITLLNLPFGIRQLRMGEGQGGAITFCTKKLSTRDPEPPYKVLDCVLRPQLSFSFPTNQMYAVFALLTRHETTTPRVLLATEEQISAETPDYPIQRQIAERKKIVNQFVQTRALSFLNDPQNQNGFCLLFLSYVFDLFILNNEVTVLHETGPKSFLKVISRVAFSDMYAQLSDLEKESFGHFYTHFLSPFGTRKIKPYKRDNPRFCYEQPLEASAAKYDLISEDERIDLQRWMDSIIHPIQRPGQTRACDLLAPPPHTARDYSMGVVKIEHINRSHALIEARGYANLEFEGEMKK